MANVENPDSYGAVGNGTTNDSPAFQAAVDQLVLSGGGTLQVSPKKYLLGPINRSGDTSRGVIIKGAPVRVAGAGWQEAPNWIDGTTPVFGSWLLASGTGHVPITVGDTTGQTAAGLRTRGTVFSGLGLQNPMALPSSGTWTAPDFQPFIDLQNTYGEVTFTDLFFPLVDKLVRASSSGRLNFAGRIRGSVLRYLAQIDKSFDVTWADDIELWPFYGYLAPVIAWQQANADAFALQRVDSVMLGRLFTYGMRAAIRTSSSADGGPSKIEVGSLLADFCKHALLVDSDGFSADIAALNYQGQAVEGSSGLPIPGNAAVQIQPGRANARIRVANLQSQRTAAEAIRLSGTDNRVEIGAALFDYANQGNDGSGGGNPAGTGCVISSSATNLVTFHAEPVIANSNNAPLISAGSVGTAYKPIPVGIAPGGTDGPAATMLAGNSLLFATPGARMNLAVAFDRVAGSFRQVLGVDTSGSTADTALLVRGQPGSVLLLAESAGAADLNITAQGTTGSVRLIGYNGHTVMRADNPNNGNTSLLVRSETNNLLILGEGPSNTDLTFAATGGSGSVRLQANNATVLRADNPNAGTTTLVVRSDPGVLLMAAEGSATNGRIVLAGRGAGGVQVESISTGRVGFFGAQPTARPIITGSRGGNTALAQLLTSLSGMGLIVDGTSP